MTAFSDRGDIIDVIKTLGSDSRLNHWFDITALMNDIEDIRNSYDIVRKKIAEVYSKLNPKYVSFYLKFYSRLMALEIIEFERIAKRVSPSDLVLKKIKPISVIEDDKLAIQSKINNFLREAMWDLDNVDLSKLDIVTTINKSLNQSSGSVTAIRDLERIAEKNPIVSGTALVQWHELAAEVFKGQKVIKDGTE
jgi:hypothetical protein